MDNSYLLIQWKFVLYCVNFEVINMDLFQIIHAILDYQCGGFAIMQVRILFLHFHKFYWPFKCCFALSLDSCSVLVCEGPPVQFIFSVDDHIVQVRLHAG